MGMNYAVINDGKFEIVRVEYDIEKTQQKMREARLPLQLINRLEKGIEGIIEGI